MTRRISSLRFVARHQELGRLGDALAEVAEGHPVAVLVGGEAGVGKSRLVREFGLAAEASGTRVLTGGAVPVGEGSLAYGPIVEAVRPLFREPEGGLVRAVGSLRSELGRLLPGIAQPARPPSSPAPTPRPAPGDRERLLELLLAMLGRLAADAPIVLVAEDVHWADQATLDAVSFLHRNLRDERVLLLLTYRSDDLGPDHPLRSALAEIERVGRTDWFELDRLDRAELEQLLTGILGHEPDARLLDRIYQRTGGNPYYAEELIALDAVDHELPATLQDVLLARVDGLGGEARSLLRAASVAGTRFDAALVSRVDGLDRGATISALREAAARHVVHPVPGPGEWFEFRHALVAEAVYASLLPADRAVLHAAWARAIAGAAVGQLDWALAAELAHHWRESGDRALALTASVRAGVAAYGAHAFADARYQFDRALDVWPQVPDAPTLAGMTRAALLEICAQAELYDGSATRAASHLRSAIELTDTAAESIRVGLLYERLAFAAGRAGMAEESRAAREAASQLVPADDQSAAWASVLAGSARDLLLAGEMAEAAAVARRSIGIAHGAGARDTEADALATLGSALGHLGELGEALTTLRRGRDLARAAGDCMALSRAWGNLAALLEGEACVREATALLEWAELVGLGRSAGLWARCLAAVSLVELGRAVEARRALDRVRSAVPEDDAEEFLWLSGAVLDLRQGRLDGAAAAVDRIKSTKRHDRDHTRRLVVGTLEAELHLARGHWADARAAARAAVDGLAAMPLGVVVFNCSAFAISIRAEAEYAIVARAQADAAGVDAAMEQGKRILRQIRSVAAHMTGDRAAHWRRPTAIAAVCEAEWSRLRGASDAARWAAAAEACVLAGQILLRPYALLRQAEALLGARRNRAAAATILREAHVAASGMEAALLVTDIEDLARRARIDLDAPRSASSAAGEAVPNRFGLTAREREVLALLADGRTNREIGEVLFITEGTASVHVSNVLGKLGVARRAEAAALAVQLSLVETRPGRRSAVVN